MRLSQELPNTDEKIDLGLPARMDRRHRMENLGESRDQLHLRWAPPQKPNEFSHRPNVTISKSFADPKTLGDGLPKKTRPARG